MRSDAELTELGWMLPFLRAENPVPVGVNYSGGTSSRWMIEAIIAGEIPRPRHVAVFQADTGDEHEWTYDDIELVKERCAAAGIPFVRCADDLTIVEDTLMVTDLGRERNDHPPFWTENPGGGRGQLTQKCTIHFKTRPIRRAQAAWLESIGATKKISTWIGFAHDEQMRATKALRRNDVKWSSLEFPAIRLGRTKARQRADMARWHLRAPRFSMCRRCPFKSPQRWTQTTERDLEGVFDFDEKIRHGLEPAGVIEPCFITDRLIPLEHLVRRGDPQPSLPGLESYCDSGQCFL